MNFITNNPDCLKGSKEEFFPSEVYHHLKESLTKTTMACIRVIDSSPPLHQKEFNQAFGKILIQEVMPLLEKENYPGGDLTKYMDHWHYAMNENLIYLAILLSEGYIQYVHVKKTISDCWYNYCGYDLPQYFTISGILNEASGDEMNLVIDRVLSENQAIVSQIKSGKEKAIGALVGKVIKEIKCDPSKIKEIILSKI